MRQRVVSVWLCGCRGALVKHCCLMTHCLDRLLQANLILHWAWGAKSSRLSFWGRCQSPSYRLGIDMFPQRPLDGGESRRDEAMQRAEREEEIVETQWRWVIEKNTILLQWLKALAVQVEMWITGYDRKRTNHFLTEILRVSCSRYRHMPQERIKTRFLSPTDEQWKEKY